MSSEIMKRMLGRGSACAKALFGQEKAAAIIAIMAAATLLRWLCAFDISDHHRRSRAREAVASVDSRPRLFVGGPL